MRFQQIKDLLLYLEQVHHQLGLGYGRLMAQVDGERSRLLLAYLQQREEAAKSQLDDYLNELGEGVKETWLERGFSEDLLPGIRRLSLPATAQTQDIVQLVCRQEEKLIGELSHLARECPTEETVRLLGGLADGAEERPAGAVHRQRQRIDPGTDFRRHRCAAAVAIEGDGEKNGHVDQGDRSDQPG